MVFLYEIFNSAAEKARNTLVKEHVPLKSHCQDGTAIVLQELGKYDGIMGISEIHALNIQEPRGPNGTHIVVSAGNCYIDPTVSQYFPSEKRLVFERLQHPLVDRIIDKRNVTKNASFFTYKRN